LEALSELQRREINDAIEAVAARTSDPLVTDSAAPE